MNRALKVQQMVQVGKAGPSQGEVYCKYSHRECMQKSLDGFRFCRRHILEDKAAPFKQCAYITKSGRRCPIAALKQERKDGFCPDHGRKTLMARQRLNRKKRPRETADSLFEELANSNSGTNDLVNGDHRRGKAHSDSLASKALEYASSSDSETEPTLVGQVWRDDGDSDADSIDSDQEDALKYAGVYTTEEVAQILRDKLIRLQALYIDQFKRLRHVLLSKRQKYLQSYRAERETLGSIKLYKKEASQRQKYDKLCAMKRYHKKFGKEGLLQKKSTERRMSVTEGLDYHPPTYHKCVFTDEGVRCSARVVPLSKFCQKHILHDPGQVLYRPCPFADCQCGRPVPALFNTEFCSLHQRLDDIKNPEANPLEVHVKEEDIKLECSAESSPALPGIANRVTPGQARAAQDEDMDVDLELDPDDLTSCPSPRHSVGQSEGHTRDVKLENTGQREHAAAGPKGSGSLLFTLGEEDEDEDGIAR